MKISNILQSNIQSNKVVFSCELFPPKPGISLGNTKKVVRQIAELNPAFMSVTCGAGGDGSQGTIEIAKEIQVVNHVPALAHMVCASLTREKLLAELSELKSLGINNIMALRGDLPTGVTEPTGDFRYASDLVAEIHKHGDFSVGGACYPEGHPEAPTIQKDIEHLKIKVEAGCHFLTTQMFFDNNVLYNFMFRLLKNGVDVPIVAGIMPVTNAKQIARIFKLSGGTVIPPRFKAVVDRFADSPTAMKQAGIAFATEQIVDLVANGINHIHVYTMNKPDIAKSIKDNLSAIFS